MTLLFSVAGEEALKVFKNVVFGRQENKEEYNTVVAKFKDGCNEQQNEITSGTSSVSVVNVRRRRCSSFYTNLKENKRSTAASGPWQTTCYEDQIVFGTNSPIVPVYGEKMLRAKRNLGKGCHAMQGG
ncbi:hypothetical protein HPB50_004652 [Hyalomma asiaticum]|uniref:Uncharacterized protein n=1 Tax=Hyalomma asiaticum TaxID=266040 RepID=A0ACB7T637_HYAAI|nr:hypothetical protein HPB50_004652 [Hyalomma asiaticum]